ncbi:MAG: sensor histidine kinase [Bacteroidia bacterium]|nr:sensor histidine kinase [Bacteroidia bacterium]
MRIRLFIFQVFLFTFTFSLNANSSTPKAVKGVIDLRDISNPDQFIVKLNGEWEFYWKKMLRPHDFKTQILKPDFFGKVPSYWTDYPRESVKTEKFGFATYRLTVLLPAGLKKPFGIDLPVFDSSYDIYIDGKYLGGNGVPGKSAAETEPEYKRNFYNLSPESDTLTIIINVANYDHRRGGFWLPVKFGTFAEVQKQLANSWAGEWSVISMLIGFSIFFLFFFLISPKEKVMGFFSIATIGLALRPLFTSHFLILNLFNMNWIWIVRFEYIGLFLVIIGWAWFVLNLYPSKFFRIIVWVITIFFFLAFVLTMLLPVKIFSYTILVYYPSMLLLMAYLLFRSFIGTLKKNALDVMYFLAFVLLLFGGLHDIRVSLGKSDSSTGYLLTYIIVIFVFIQAVILLYKWIRVFHDKEKLQIQLEFMNRNLELFVNERTLELKTRNEEIEKQNSMIALQNKQLSDTIQLKNRVFSVIAHDLRSPVVNILYMLNLLKEKEYKEKYDTFANSSIQYAQLVISLLENMLVWGRGQEDKIKFSPEKRDLADIILTNLSIFKETADKKDIPVNFTQVGSSIAFFDKDLLDIIIRNLLSNAVKYTSRGGRISILLKNKSMTGEGIMLKICDNGVGIPENKQKYLFTSTEIGSSPGTENEKGTGLGLKLCNELVRLNNGSIAVESKEGEGTCFIITLPVENGSLTPGKE